MDHRDVTRRGSGAVLGALVVNTVREGATPAEAAILTGKMGDPARTGEALPFPENLTAEERRNLETFDEADFVVVSGFTRSGWRRAT
jgi:hypothetical protein